MKRFKSFSALLNLSLAILSLTLLTRCKTVSHEGDSAADSTTELGDGVDGVKNPAALSRQDAAFRAQEISQIHYQLWFSVGEEGTDFQGKTTVQFHFKPHPKAQHEFIALDFEGGDVASIFLNQKKLGDGKSSKRFDGHHLFFKRSEIQTGLNQIEVTYSHPYSKEGRGLHRFKDPVDAEVYLYSHFEPYEAHRMFPCFDQPDLKATFEVSVEAPKRWQVISNMQEKIKTTHFERTIWIFPVSPLFSTYLFAVHAGPYKMWKQNTKGAAADGIPMRLFARKSLAPYIRHEEWFQVTRSGLEFYGNYFGYPYPFFKYDQVVVPEFNAGAMENVAAVTFSERYIIRSKVTLDQRRNLADTILHEMAHMWFGDLVTMKWWNGLWLNESFATFMAATAVDHATSFKGSWEAFFSQMKQWAYWEDQLVTTHPIELPVPTTDHADAIFDGITYGKGASVLKQLSYYIGEEEFREGLQRYFQKYAYKNTSLKDFIQMLSESSGKALDKWEQTWLRTSGVNTVNASWECSPVSPSGKSQVSKFNLFQTPKSSLRPHRMQIGLYTAPKGSQKELKLSPKQTFDLSYQEDLTLVEAALKQPCPELVVLNAHDYDYVKVELDPVTLEKIEETLHKIADPLIRQLFWHQLWEMVVDGKLSPQRYTETALKQLSKEKETLIVSDVLRTLITPQLFKNTALKFLSESMRAEMAPRLEQLAWAQAQKASGGSDLQLIWYQGFLKAVTTPQGIQTVQKLLTGMQKLKAFPIDQERRWELIQTLSRKGVTGTPTQILSELSHDTTDMGQRSAIIAEAMNPDPILKQGWLDQIFRKQDAVTPVTQAILAQSPTQKSLPVAKLRDAMANVFLLGQEDVVKTARSDYFEKLIQVGSSHSGGDEEYATMLARLMFPYQCDTASVQKAAEVLASHSSDLSPTVVKNLKIHRQEEERCIRARLKAMEPSRRNLGNEQKPSNSLTPLKSTPPDNDQSL